MEYGYGIECNIVMKNEPHQCATGNDKSEAYGCMVWEDKSWQKRSNNNKISYKKKLDSHITELVAERNRERPVSIHAKQIAQNI